MFDWLVDELDQAQRHLTSRDEAELVSAGRLTSRQFTLTLALNASQYTSRPSSQSPAVGGPFGLPFHFAAMTDFAITERAP